MSKDKRPLLSDGSIVSDYSPLLKYIEIARRVSPDRAEEGMPRSEDFEYVKKYMWSRGGSTLYSLLEALTAIVLARIDPEIARDALREVYGVEFDPEDARERIARILAGWIIEASRILGYISY